MNSNVGNCAVTGLLREIERGCAIVRDLSDDEFAIGRGGQSPVGAHIRHNLDFVNALLNGIDERTVDYNARLRDPRVETDREYAIEQLAMACSRLEAMTRDVCARLVMVRSEIDVDVWHTSSVAREIEFLHSHTVHHYALVRMLVGETESSLGVSPSTLRFRSSDRRGSFAAGNY